MGIIQPKAHPRWFESKENKEWFYILLAIIVIIFITIMIKL